MRLDVTKLIAGALAVALGCTNADQPFEPTPCEAPRITSASAQANPVNVLSAIITARVPGADSVVVRYWEAGGSPSAVPAVTAAADTAMVPVLGLHPQTSYTFQLTAYNACGLLASQEMALTTGTLPGDLPSYTAGGSAPLPGYVVFAAGNYGLVIDNTGRVVWYRKFEVNGPGLSFQVQPNGRYTARPNPMPGSQAAWEEFDNLGNRTRTLGCAKGLDARFHDLIVRPDGSYWIMCDEVRTVDLSDRGGFPATQVVGTTVQRISATSQLLFEWSPFDHIEIDPAELPPGSLGAPPVNWTHGNAIDLAPDGSLLLSYRNLSTILRINTINGTLISRFGGLHSDYDFGSAQLPFDQQHGIRAVGTNRLMILDNLGDVEATHAEVYELHDPAWTATLVFSHASPRRVIGRLGGSVQNLAQGRVLVSFGNGRAVEEVDSSGNVVWEIGGDPGYIFRAQRIQSLYRPGALDTR